MAKVLPKNVSELTAIDGVGVTRSDKYGTRFLRKIVEFCNAHPELNPKDTKKAGFNSLDVESTGDPDFKPATKKFYLLILIN